MSFIRSTSSDLSLQGPELSPSSSQKRPPSASSCIKSCSNSPDRSPSRQSCGSDSTNWRDQTSQSNKRPASASSLGSLDTYPTSGRASAASMESLSLGASISSGTSPVLSGPNSTGFDTYRNFKKTPSCIKSCPNSPDRPPSRQSYGSNSANWRDQSSQSNSYDKSSPKKSKRSQSVNNMPQLTSPRAEDVTSPVSFHKNPFGSFFNQTVSQVQLDQNRQTGRPETPSSLTLEIKSKSADKLSSPYIDSGRGSSVDTNSPRSVGTQQYPFSALKGQVARPSVDSTSFSQVLPLKPMDGVSLNQGQFFPEGTLFTRLLIVDLEYLSSISQSTDGFVSTTLDYKEKNIELNLPDNKDSDIYNDRIALAKGLNLDPSDLKLIEDGRNLCLITMGTGTRVATPTERASSYPLFREGGRTINDFRELVTPKNEKYFKSDVRTGAVNIYRIDKTGRTERCTFAGKTLMTVKKATSMSLNQRKALARAASIPNC